MILPGLVTRGKRYDVTDLKAQTLNANFEQLFADVKALVSALKAKDLDADRIVCSLTHSAPQAIPSSTSTFTRVLFDTDVEDAAGCHDPLVQTTRLTVPTGGAGVWWFDAYAAFAINPTGIRAILFAVNDVPVGPYAQIGGSATDYIHLHLTTLRRVADRDYVEVWAYQDSGGSVDLGPVPGPASTRFQAMRIGD